MIMLGVVDLYQAAALSNFDSKSTNQSKGCLSGITKCYVIFEALFIETGVSIVFLCFAYVFKHGFSGIIMILMNGLDKFFD